MGCPDVTIMLKRSSTSVFTLKVSVGDVDQVQYEALTDQTVVSGEETAALSLPNVTWQVQT